MMSEVVDAVVTSNQASHARRVAVTTVAVQRIRWRRQVAHAITAKLAISSESKPTQVVLQCVATYRSGSVLASMTVHGITATQAPSASTAGPQRRRARPAC